MATPQSPTASNGHGQVTDESASLPHDSLDAAMQPGDNEPQPREGDPVQGTESTNQASKILYRYLVKDDNGDIVEKEESPNPIKVRMDDKAEGLTDQIVLEVITTREVSKSLRSIFRKQPLHTVVKIHSQHLINALRQVIRYYPGVSLSGVPVTIQYPFMPLVHYTKELEQYKTNHPQGHDEDLISTTNSHIDILLGFLGQSLGQELLMERERHLRQPPVATFEYLWLLFRPGDQVFDRDPDPDASGYREEYEPYVFSMIIPPEKGVNIYEFLVWRIDSVGGSLLGPHEGIREIDEFEGEKEISSLAMCPRAFLPIHSQVEEKFIARGRKVVSLFDPAYMEYTGRAHGPSIEINGKIMVDSQSWLRYSDMGDIYATRASNVRSRYGRYLYRSSLSDGCECRVCEQIVAKASPTLPINHFTYWGGEAEKLNNDFYLLCSPVVRGYALNERKWVEFYVDRVSEPKIDHDPFSNLVLENEIKDTIEALVCNYAQLGPKVESWGKDFVRDKGEGRIFLLHGSPGVGKTCTAECVADLIKRPLLPLTCGDMGVTASEVEKNFNLFFELGERWGAVVLMDEADIYLEQRTSENLERNSLVSVFLRSLEYFRGILFLTTNRVGAFDDAFISRIHVALHYRRLTNDYRAKIWEKHFNRLGEEGSISIAPGAIIYVTSDPDAQAVEWNGREIRNAFQTAVALAQYQARKDGDAQVVLRADHLKRVVKMSRLFKDYIDSTHKNQDEGKRAIIEERRNDLFDAAQRK